MIVMALLFAALPCASQAGPSPKTIKLNLTSKTIGIDSVNSSFELRISMATNGGGVEWSTGDAVMLQLTPDPNDPSRCFVSSTAQKNGTTYVQAMCGDATARCKVTVKRTLKATKLSLNKTKATLYLGSDGVRDQFQLVPKILPSNASARDPRRELVNWKSSAKKRATVDEFGVVTPIGLGKVKISCALGDGSKRKAICTLTIKPVVPSSVSLEPLSVELGGHGQVNAVITPSDALNQDMIWKSSNIRVASVSSTGVVRGVGLGSATLSCTTKSGGRKASCTVTVVGALPTPNPSTLPTPSPTPTAEPGDTPEPTPTPAASPLPSPTPALCGPKYFFYGIGNQNYTPELGSLKSAISDTMSMRAAFSGAKYTSGGARCVVKTNQTSLQILQLLDSMSQNSEVGDDDVSIFYYEGFNGAPFKEDERGALLGVDGKLVTVDDVQLRLDKVKGKVLVLMDIDGAGSYIGAPHIQKGVRALEKALTDSMVSGKYKILTACGADERVNGDIDSDGEFSLFSRMIVKGLSGECPADANRDGMVTLNELYRYVDAGVAVYINAFSGRFPEQSFSQSVRVWPEGDDFVVYVR